MVAEKFAQAYAKAGVAPPGTDVGGFHQVAIDAAAEASAAAGGAKSRKFRITRKKRSSETVGSRKSNKKTKSKK
jgi:hypothetical protein